ncbi:MAG: ribokinase [Actinomycetota bacterium]|nr:ribokinase [Actinomycetota bacterium]
MTESSPSVAVVGSLNLDLVVPVPHHPRPGETVLGSDHFSNPGGKGANQAVAAARLGRRVAMVGCVGGDDAGTDLRASLAAEGVDVDRVVALDDAPTGIALISVDEAGENTIIVSPGANARVDVEAVEGAMDILGSAAVTLLQLEIPVETVAAAADSSGGTVVLNLAPGRPLPGGLLAQVDVLVPNLGELGVLSGGEAPDDLDAAASVASDIDGPDAVVVTLGPEGALVVTRDGSLHVPGVEVKVVDTTAAGDSFCGALADALVRGLELEHAVRWAVTAAALTVTKKGAQQSLPTRAEVEGLMT